MTRQNLQVFAALALVASLVGCERAPQASTRPNNPDRIVFILPSKGSVFAEDFAAAARTYLADWSGGLELVQPAAPTTEALLAAIARIEPQPRQRMIANAVCVYLPSDVETARVLEALRARPFGLIVTLGDDWFRPDAAYAHVTFDWVSGAELLAEQVPVALAGRRAYATIAPRLEARRAARLVARYSLRSRDFAAPSELARVEVAGPASVGDAVARLFEQYRNIAVLALPTHELELIKAARSALPTSARYVALCATPDLWRDVETGRAAALVGPVYPEAVRRALRFALAGILGESAGEHVSVVRCEVVTRETLGAFAKRYRALCGAPASQPATTQPAGRQPAGRQPAGRQPADTGAGSEPRRAGGA